MSESWNLTPAQRLQFREAHAEAKLKQVAEREMKAQREHCCPRCHTPKLNRCRDDDGTLLEHPHPERVKLVKES